MTRVSPGVPGAPVNVASEVAGVPPGFQPEAAGDLFITADPACVPLGANIQLTDGNGGQCFAGTNAICTSTAAKDKCL